MAEYRAPLDDVFFVIKYQLNISWSELGFTDVDLETVNAVFSEAAKIAENVLAPLDRNADEEGCTWLHGDVITPEGFKKAYQIFCDGGWSGLSGPTEFGGMGFPKSLVASVDELVQGGCMALGLLPMLTAGASLAINTHGSDTLKQRYLPNMISGKWAGAMDLTEPDAGTDLGLIKTKAQPQSDGSYTITGTKIFITWGEHDMAENIVHLVLAKLPNAPQGAKGISMFLVPKYLPDDNGKIGERNAVNCGALEKKMGIKASATCVMNFDGAKGWLLGPENKGLTCMFTMMNYERLVVGIQAVGAAEKSYQTAEKYARERLQSRSPSGIKYPNHPADPIIELPDIRRMLLTMRANIEAGRAFYTYVANWLDVANYSNNVSDKTVAQQRVALLTPVAKAFLTDTCFDAAIMGQQILGGHGYIREWGQEQIVRDIRITQIYEGTNGIQALDLISRKTVACNAELLFGFVGEVETYIADYGEGCELKEPLIKAMQVLKSTTTKLQAKASANPSYMAFVATDYMNLFGRFCFGYMWFRAAVACEHNELSLAFSRAKLATAKFYFARLLPEMAMYSDRINASECCVNIGNDVF